MLEFLLQRGLELSIIFGKKMFVNKTKKFVNDGLNQ